ncbi:MAG: NAD(P)H-hydrate dehydratase [Chloroflexia bacterium]
MVAAPSGEVQVMTEPHPELGTAGSGDVLAGLCGYLVACGNEPAQAARAALVIGARAGALAAEAVGRDAVGPVDLIAALPKARAAQ